MSYSKELCVTCPSCGKLHQRSVITDSSIKCARCGHDFYAYLKHGVLIVTEHKARCMSEKIVLLRNYADKLVDVLREN